jgi:hypothetical protein
MSCDPDWLDKAIRIVEKQIHEMNKNKGARYNQKCFLFNNGAGGTHPI